MQTFIFNKNEDTWESEEKVFNRNQLVKILALAKTVKQLSERKKALFKESKYHKYQIEIWNKGKLQRKPNGNTRFEKQSD